jgi:hypothetical protein
VDYFVATGVGVRATSAGKDLRVSVPELPTGGHDTLILPCALLQGLRLPPSIRVLDLEPGSGAENCDARGTAAVSIRLCS